MAMRGTITYVASPEVTRRQLPKIVKEALLEVGEDWHKRILPKHFTREGARRYGYRDRTKEHQRRKGRRFGHQDPLVFSGDMKRQVLRRQEIKATSKKMTVILRGPKYMFMFRKTARGTLKGLKGAARRSAALMAMGDKAAELTATTREELLEQARLLDQKIQEKIDGITTRETKRFA